MKRPIATFILFLSFFLFTIPPLWAQYIPGFISVEESDGAPTLWTYKIKHNCTQTNNADGSVTLDCSIVPVADIDDLPGDTTDNDKIDGTLLAPASVQSVTCNDSGDGNPGTLTITPTAGLLRVDISITVNDANGCTITMAETGAVEGTMVILTNISAANTATFSTSAGVITLKLGSPYVMGANEMLIIQYKGGAWLESGRTGAEQTTLLDDAAQFANASDTTKKVKIDPSNQGAGQTGIIQAPVNGTATLVAGTVFVKTQVFQKCFTALAVTTASDFPVEIFPYAITITGVRVYQVGATNVVGQFDECTGASGVCTSLTTVDADITGTADTWVSDDGSLSNGGIAANNGIYWHTTSVSGTNTSLTACFLYTIN